MPLQVGAIRREHVEAFLADILERFKPATAANKFRSLQQFFRWLLEEGEITEGPMRNMRPPHVPEEPVPILSEGNYEASSRLVRVAFSWTEGTWLSLACSSTRA